MHPMGHSKRDMDEGDAKGGSMTKKRDNAIIIQI